MTTARISHYSRRRTLAVALSALLLVSVIGAQRASAEPYVGMPAAASGSHYIGWDSDVHATCLFSRSFFVTTGDQIDVYLPDVLKARSFYARPWMKVVQPGQSRWFTTGWHRLDPSTDTAYPIKFTWNVSGRGTAFYPAIELYFPQERVRTFSLAVTNVAGSVTPGGAQPCYIGG